MPAGVYLGLLVVMLAVSWFTIAHWERSFVTNMFGFRGASALGALAHYDGGWYWQISHHGYEQHPSDPDAWSPVAFFPAYPLLMAAVGTVVRDHGFAGILITVACGLSGAVAFWHWCRPRLAPTATTVAVLLLLLYPYGYYLYGVIYSDALFLLVTLVAFHAVERDRPLVAGLAGAFATFSRPVGIAVAVGLVVRTLERRGALTRPRWLGIPSRLELRKVRPGDGLVLLSVSGLLAYMGFLWARFGDPFLFQSVQSAWGHEASPRTWLKVEYFRQVAESGVSGYSLTLTAQAVLTVAALAAVPLVGRRFGWGYGVYVLMAIGIPAVGVKDFLSVGRYIIAAFPLFALVGERLESMQPRVYLAVLAAWGVALVGAMHLFSRGLYLA